MKLFKSHSRLNIRSNFFTQRVIGSWNSLQDEIVTANIIGACQGWTGQLATGY